MRRHPTLDDSAFYRELFSLAVPIGLQSLLTALIGATDALMLGSLSQDAVSAVSLANQIAFIMSLFTGAAIGGGGVLIAQYYGRHDRRMVTNLLCMLLRIALFISFLFFALAMLVPGQLMRLYTRDAHLIKIGASYLRIVSLSYLFSGMTQCHLLVMKTEGNAARCVMISAATPDMTPSACCWRAGASRCRWRCWAHSCSAGRCSSCTCSCAPMRSSSCHGSIPGIADTCG